MLGWLACLCCALPLAAAAGVEVRISGVDSEIEANIRATLDLVRHGEREGLSEATVRRLFSRSRRQVREAMRPFGYYRPAIDASLEQKNGEWLARFTIDRGQPVLVTDIDVRLSGEGEQEPRLLAVIADTPMRKGRRLRHQEYDRLRNDLQATAAALGYFEAQLEQRRLEVDPVEREARVVLHMVTGPRYRFGTIEVEQDIINEGLLRRIVLIREGEHFDANRLLQTQYRLIDSLYFASVVVETDTPDPATRTVGVRVETIPTRRQRIRLGLGYATDTRARASIRSDWRHVNRAGHSAGTELRVGSTLTEMSGRYLIPIRDPLKERLVFRGGVTNEDLADLESQRATLGASHVTVRGGSWQRTLFTDAIYERTLLPDEPDFSETLIVPGIAMEKLIADDLLFPRRGFRLRVELRGSQQLLGASSDFLRLDIEANRVLSAGENWRFFTRSRLGTSVVDGFATLPASQRFFAGGDLSVRGYGFNTLGPRDDAGNVIGGRHLMLASVEAERRVWGRVALAAFADAGNAVDSFSEGLEASVGTGLNIHTPVGTLRLSLARSVTESRGTRFHLTIRPDL
jgi:translocation and assembly module TamA